MYKAQQTNDKSIIKSSRLIWLWTGIGFLLPFLIFLFLKSDQLSGQFLYAPLIHSFVLLIACGAAFYVTYIALRGYWKSQGINLFITGLAFYTFGFVFFLHGIAVLGTGWFSEAFFDVTEHYGLFLGSFILLGLFLPWEGLKEFFYQHKVRIFLGWVVFLLTAFIVLVFSPPLTEILEATIHFFIGLTIPLVVITLIFMLVSYQRNQSNLLVYFIIGLAILVNSAIIPFFYQEWNFLWWYFHFTFLLPFLVILFGLLKYRYKKEEIVEALVQTPFYKKLGSKLLVIFLLVGLLPLAIFGFFNIQNSKTDLQKEISNKMLLLAEAKEGQVFSYLDNLEGRTLDFSFDGFIRDSLREIVHTNSKDTVEVLHEYLVKDKQVLDPFLVGILLVDMDGKVVAATDEEEIGEDESKDSYFIEGKKGLFMTDLYEEVHFGLKYIFVVSAPLTDKATGKTLGVIMNFFDPGKLNDILSGEFQMEKGAMTGREGMPESMETYLVNRGKRMLTYSHKMDRGTIADILPVKKCLEEEKEVIATYFNYSRQEVIGASMCIIRMGWTLAVEISIKEAFAPISQMQQRLTMAVLLAAVLVVGLTLFFSRIITGPIKKLHEATEVITEGNLDYRVEIKTGDEIEQLAGAFNQMAAELKESYSGLQQKVEKKTKDLAQKVEELEKFNKLTIGRELKMIELKKENSELKKKAGRLL